MTEERKSIIELIEPYMNKELSEGCLVKYDFRENWGDIMKVIDIESNKRYTSIKLWLDRYNVRDIQDNLNNFKVIWHYDITAVLKYIDNEHREKNVCYMAWEESNWFWDFDWDIFEYTDTTFKPEKCSCWANISKNKTFSFPNKPLHLYTEQEEKDLLKLLKELWKQLKKLLGKYQNTL